MFAFFLPETSPNYVAWIFPAITNTIAGFILQEAFGKYLDMHELYNQYNNLKFEKPIEYSAYLDIFSQPNIVPRKLKFSRWTLSLSLSLPPWFFDTFLGVIFTSICISLWIFYPNFKFCFCFNFLQAIQGIHGESTWIFSLFFPADRALARSW